MFQKIVRFLGGDPQGRALKKYLDLVNQINELEPRYESLEDDQLAASTAEFRERVCNGETLEDILPEAFAVVKETARRFKENSEMRVKATDMDRLLATPMMRPRFPAIIPLLLLMISDFAQNVRVAQGILAQSF